MEKRNTVLAWTLFAASVAMAQEPWRMHLKCAAENVVLRLDLYEETVRVPGMDMFGPMNGYMGGDVYGVWMVTSFKIQNDRAATLRLSNDLGSETQQASLTQQSDSTWCLRLEGARAMKRVRGRKLVKLPPEFLMTKDR